MRRSLLPSAVFLTCFAVASLCQAQSATCPFDIPVVNVPTGQHQSGFNWTGPIRPLGDACVWGMAIDKEDELTWYIYGQNGLYVTRDGGATWSRTLTGYVKQVKISPDPDHPIFAVGLQNLFASHDHGRTWRLIRHFESAVVSLLVLPGGRIYVGPAYTNEPTPNGLFLSEDGGSTWKFLPFGGTWRGLICWVIGRDPRDGTLYVGTEIYDHPQPYKPPLLRSKNGGQTWSDITGSIGWHVIDIEVRPTDGYVYALTEGAGLYGSQNQGSSWKLVASGPTLDLLMDPLFPWRLFGGAHSGGDASAGGAFTFRNGEFFEPIGLVGGIVADLALDFASTRLFAVLYASGLYQSTVTRPGCLPSPTVLCLSNGRFKVESTWRTRNGATGLGQAVPLSGDTGYFWFFSSTNVEVVFKVLNACTLNQRFWVFAGGLTDVEVTTKVTDTLAGTVKTYTNVQGTPFKPLQDTDAFSTCSAAAAGAESSPHAFRLEREELASSSTPDEASLLLQNDRFRVDIEWQTTDGHTGKGHAVPLTSDSGYFWFFADSNVEIIIKILNACEFNNRYWVFAGGLTNVKTRIVVTDMLNEISNEYNTPLGKPFQPILDSSAFATCP